MHELPVTERILSIALRHAAQNEATKIFSITVKVGGLTDLRDTWLQHYFDYLSKDTIAEGAKLLIIKEKALLQCGKCKTQIATTKEDVQDLKCPQCHANQGFTILSGKEYFIEEMMAE